MKKMIIYWGIKVLILGVPIIKAQVPTYADDIACIMYSHCTKCHHPGGIGPMSFMDYTQTANYAQAILNMVEGASNKTHHLSTEMPPWPPDNTYQKYAYDPTLTPQEIQAIRDWVNHGTPQGNPSNAPNPPSYSSQGSIPNPDFSDKIQTFTSNASNDDVYRYFAIPTNFSTNKFISEWEILPGNPEIVHHVLIFVDPTGNALIDEANDPNPGYYKPTNSAFSDYKLVGVWAPGQLKFTAPAGFGYKLEPNAAIVLQIHYPAGSIGQVDSTRIQLRFANGTTRELYTSAPLNHATNSLQNGPLFIPANTTKSFTETFTVPNLYDLTVIAVAPHMHLIGRSIETYGVKPNGDTLKFIRINNWNFSWQGNYFFQKPIKVPKQTVLWSNAFYDNTSNNPFNPSTPPQDVWVGEATTDEMMMTFFTFALYMQGDENIIIDTSIHAEHHNYCSMLTHSQSPSTNLQNSASVFPNPVQKVATVLTSSPMEKLELWDYQGRVLGRWNTQNLKSFEMDLSWIPSGCYFFNVYYSNHTQESVQFLKQ